MSLENMSLNVDSLKLLFEVELKKCPIPGVKQIKKKKKKKNEICFKNHMPYALISLMISSSMECQHWQ
jgi:hypothetical protein